MPKLHLKSKKTNWQEFSMKNFSFAFTSNERIDKINNNFLKIKLALFLYFGCYYFHVSPKKIYPWKANFVSILNKEVNLKPTILNFYMLEPRGLRCYKIILWLKIEHWK